MCTVQLFIQFTLRKHQRIKKVDFEFPSKKLQYNQYKSYRLFIGGFLMQSYVVSFFISFFFPPRIRLLSPCRPLTPPSGPQRASGGARCPSKAHKSQELQTIWLRSFSWENRTVRVVKFQIPSTSENTKKKAQTGGSDVGWWALQFVTGVLFFLSFRKLPAR